MISTTARGASSVALRSCARGPIARRSRYDQALTVIGSIEYLGIASALLLAAAHVHVERVGVRRNEAWRPFRRSSGKLTAGPVMLRVELVSYDGEPVRVGTSVEPRNGHSVLPAITCDAVTVRVIDGPKLKLRRDATLRAEHVEGAVRTTLELIDTPEGPRRVCAYELPANKPLWLIGHLPREVHAGTDGPFRGDSIGEIDPCGGEYALSERPPDRWIAGCGAPIAATLALVILGAALASHTGLWALVAMLGLAAYGLQWLTLPNVAPTQLEQPRVALREQANDRAQDDALVEDARAGDERSRAGR